MPGRGIEKANFSREVLKLLNGRTWGTLEDKEEQKLFQLIFVCPACKMP
jgi:hypothetical protein